jgi:hypothetical protein
MEGVTLFTKQHTCDVRQKIRIWPANMSCAGWFMYRVQMHSGAKQDFRFTFGLCCSSLALPSPLTKLSYRCTASHGELQFDDASMSLINILNSTMPRKRLYYSIILLMHLFLQSTLTQSNFMSKPPLSCL